jgi:MazG family protein
VARLFARIAIIMSDPVAKFAEFVAIVRRLRNECPWDREQTHESIRAMLLEEAYEVMESIEAKDMDELRKELGDILLHVVMHAVIAEETDAFTLAQIIDGETKKLVHRHPHVFGDVVANDAVQVKKNWEKLKLEEQGRKSILDGVPRTMPALQRAQRLQQKAASVGFDWNNAQDVWKKVEEEIRELRDAGATQSKDAVEDEFGDVLFTLVNFARFLKINPEDALRGTIEKFITRFHHVEERAADAGKALDKMTLEEMDVLWEEAKKKR